MRLAEIANDENSCRPGLMPEAEAKFAAACKGIESGNWDKVYEILDLLARQTLPSDLAHAVRVMSDILDPANSPDETVEKISQFLPGKSFRVYDDKHGWYEGAMGELAEVERDFSEPAWESRSETASGPSTML